MKWSVTILTTYPHRNVELPRVVAGSRRVAINRALKHWSSGVGKGFRGDFLQVEVRPAPWTQPLPTSTPRATLLPHEP